MRGGEQGVGQRHCQRDARPEIKHVFIGDGRGKSSNNKLKARGWEISRSANPPPLAGFRWDHGLFSPQHSPIRIVFLMNGSHFVFPVWSAVCISAKRCSLYAAFLLNGCGFLLCAREVSLEAFPLNGLHFRCHF